MWSWRSHDEFVPYDLLPSLTKDRTIKPWDQTFIVIAVGTGRGFLLPAGLGALAACALVFVVGIAAHRPLSQVPENMLKLGVGVSLSAFGVFWTGEDIGLEWPGHAR